MCRSLTTSWHLSRPPGRRSPTTTESPSSSLNSNRRGRARPAALPCYMDELRQTGREMSIVVGESRGVDISHEQVRAGSARRFALSDQIFSTGTRVAALIVLFILAGIALSRILGCYEALAWLGLARFATLTLNAV